MTHTENGVLTLQSPSWDRGDWMQTYTGIAFYPLAPRAEEIHALDIAHGISMQCRYNGHVSRFYSVAEHCVLIAEYLLDIGASKQIALWGLLHDGTESYVGDMVRPLKKHMPDFSAAEDVVMGAIRERFGLEQETMPEGVRMADNRILLDERAALLRTPPQPWAVEGLTPLGVQISGWDPVVAKEMYLLLLEELTGESFGR
jgi:hypothetical protein